MPFEGFQGGLELGSYDAARLQPLGWLLRVIMVTFFTMCDRYEKNQHVRGVSHRIPRVSVHTQRNDFEILINQPEIILYLPFCD